MAIITIPDALRDRLGPEGAQALVDLMNRATQEMRDDVVTIAAEKFERRLAEELRSLETRLIRWMFGFWVTTILTILLALKL